ncbi:MAG: CoA-binding protein [Deltaproteobacteria bacterium]|nr:CoA-binding protein [Deltaproteobacteria bacterium]
MENVAIVGASSKEERYSWKAQKMLMERGHRVFPVSSLGKNVLGVVGFRSLLEITEPLDTVTLYVGPARLPEILPALLAQKPRRVIFNPGTEHPQAMAVLGGQGIRVEAACTLVLLATGQF